jgi:hypothetical protein
MPQFPVYERQVGLSGGATASYASGEAFTAPARALSGMGDAIADVGSKFAEVERKINETRGSAWFSKARAQAALKARRVQDTSDDVPTAMESVTGIFTEEEGTAPNEYAKSIFRSWTSGYSGNVQRTVAVSQAAKELAWRSADFASAVGAHAAYVEQYPDEFTSVMSRAEDDLVGARQWMAPEEYQAAERQTRMQLYDAFARSMMDRDPEGLLEMAEADELPGDLNEFYRDAASRKIEEENFRIERDEYSAEGQAYLDLFSQVVGGTVDTDWVEANRDILGESGYYAALGEGIAKEDRTDPVSPRWRDDLYSLSLSDPEQSLFSAWDQYSSGMLSRDTFAMIYATAMDANSPEGRTRNSARRYLDTALGKDEGRFDVIREFESYISQNPKASAVDLQDHAEKLAKPFRQARTRQKIMTMPRPRFGPPVAKPDAAAMDAARANTAKKLQDGAISAREAAEEARKIREWLKAMETFDD